MTKFLILLALCVLATLVYGGEAYNSGGGNHYCSGQAATKYCQYGQKVDSYGCRLDACKCNPNYHCNKICDYGYVKDEYDCPTCECKCNPNYHCNKICDYGYVKDEYDCPTCECKCSSDYHCDKKCAYGYKKDGYGCNICECNGQYSGRGNGNGNGFIGSGHGNNNGNGRGHHDARRGRCPTLSSRFGFIRRYAVRSHHQCHRDRDCDKKKKCCQVLGSKRCVVARY